MLEVTIDNGNKIKVFSLSSTEDRHLYISATVEATHEIQAQVLNKNVVNLDFFLGGSRVRTAKVIYRSAHTDMDDQASAGQVAFFSIDEILLDIPNRPLYHLYDKAQNEKENVK